MSMFVKVTAVKGVSNLEKKLKELGKQADEYRNMAVKQSVLLVDGTAKKLIQSKSPGKKQTRYKPKRIVTASNPGEAPNTDRGRLVQSIKFEITNNGATGLVGTNLKYGKALEFGTKNMQARPWLSTALKMNFKQIDLLFRNAIKQAVSKVSK